MTRVTDAFRFVNRQYFVLPEYKDDAHLDVPMPIGAGQTISQPYTVRLMLEWLGVRAGDMVLDVGSGSGWTSALLAHLTGADGKVVAVERIPELLAFGRANAKRAKVRNVEFHQASKVVGWPRQAPYKRILVSATAQQIPEPLLEQLAIGGTMVIPVNNVIMVVRKDRRGHVNTEEHHGFVFVPLVEG